MPQESPAKLLYHLLAVVGKSFPQYLRYSRPYIPAGWEGVTESLQTIMRDQDVFADRIAHMIGDFGFPVRRGEFPMSFTDSHDLGIAYQITVAIEYQRQDIETIGRIVSQLQFFPAAKSLAEEALGMAKGHLDTLQELATLQAVVS
jgi:hypothetical protein